MRALPVSPHDRNRAIALRTSARVGADMTAAAPPSKDEEKGLMAFLWSSTGFLIVSSIVGLWLVTRSA